MVATAELSPSANKAKSAAIYGFFLFLQFMEELSTMACWTTNHKWQYACTGFTLIQLTGIVLPVGVMVAIILP